MLDAGDCSNVEGRIAGAFFSFGCGLMGAMWLGAGLGFFENFDSLHLLKDAGQKNCISFKTQAKVEPRLTKDASQLNGRV